MRLLVLGGTVFLSHAVAAEALARGHEVVCAARGRSGQVPDGVTLIEVDRTGPLPALPRFDAVVDVARHPSWVRRALDATPGTHWVFVSTVNVYADDATPGGRPGVTPLVEPREDDADLATEPEAYGPMKVACERLVLDRASSATVIRPGLIVGPGDPTGRFSYWSRRLALAPPGSEVLAPGEPSDSMQVIDVRDLAAWIVTVAEARTTGTYDGVGPSMPLAELLTQCAEGVGADVVWTWVPQEFLDEEGVKPWIGPDAIPLWVPRPEHDGFAAHDVTPSLAAGLRVRPLADSARDTVDEAEVTGITREREAELLAAWRERLSR